jgi:hypothetical protein
LSRNVANKLKRRTAPARSRAPRLLWRPRTVHTGIQCTDAREAPRWTRAHLRRLCPACAPYTAPRRALRPAIARPRSRMHGASWPTRPCSIPPRPRLPPRALACKNRRVTSPFFFSGRTRRRTPLLCHHRASSLQLTKRRPTCSSPSPSSPEANPGHCSPELQSPPPRAALRRAPSLRSAEVNPRHQFRRCG